MTRDKSKNKNNKTQVEDKAITQARKEFIDSFTKNSEHKIKWVGIKSPDDPDFPTEGFHAFKPYNPEEYILIEHHVFEMEAAEAG